MSTSNFAQYDESFLHVIEIMEDDDFIVDDTIENIKADLQFYTKHKKYSLYDFGNKRRDVLPIGSIYFNDDISIDIFITYGYYEHATINIEVNNDTNKNYKYIQKTINDIERILSQYTTSVKRIATFSNGESIYQKI